MIEMIGIHTPLVVGMFITQRLLRIPDLSMETAYMIGGMSSCFLMPHLTTIPSYIAAPILLCTALSTGALVGLCSSMITTRLGISHLFSAIITAGIWVGILFACMSPYQGITGYTNHLIIIKSWGIIPAILLLNSIVALLCILLMRSQYGYLAIAAGSNPRFFATFGLPYNTVFCTGVIIANALSGLSGYLVAQTIFFADIHMGLGKLLFALVALMIGRLITASPFALFVAPLCGTTIQIMLQQILLRIGFNLNYFSLVHGLILLILIAAVQRSGNKALSEMGF